MSGKKTQTFDSYEHYCELLRQQPLMNILLSNNSGGALHNGWPKLKSD